MRIIRKSISLANTAPLEETEIKERAKDWAEVLFAIIPEDRLAAAFSRAARLHDSNFPISAYELKIADEEIRREEIESKRNTASAQKRISPGSPSFEPCGVCFGCGFADISRRIKCPACDYWEIYRQKHEL